MKIGGETDGRGWDGWMASPSQWTWVWVGSGSYDRQGSLVCCSSWGPKSWTQLSDWTELRLLRFLFYGSSVYFFHLFLISLLLLGLYYLCLLFVPILHKIFVGKKLNYGNFFSKKFYFSFFFEDCFYMTGYYFQIMASTISPNKSLKLPWITIMPITYAVLNPKLLLDGIILIN